STSSTSTTTTTTTPICPSRIYSQSFVSGVYSASLCSAWTSFVASLTCSTYKSFTLSGTYNTNGINATNSVVVNAIATALRTSSTYSGTSNGVTWYVGTCGGGMELASTAVCACATGYSIRPCIGDLNWGGVNSATCSGPSQVITLSFQ
ncbi:unnamed protein product, partial [Adineta steineri]